MLRTTCLLAAVMFTAVASAEAPRFAEPEIILDGARYLYPSPVYEDVDDDGQRELLIGDLRGHLVAYENTSDDGPPVWRKPATSLQMAGEQFGVPNW